NAGLSAPQASVGSGWSATPYGAGCAGVLGVPSLQALSAPFGDTTFYLAGGNAPPSAIGFVVLSAGQQPFPVDLGDGICSNVQSPFKWSFGLTGPTGHFVLGLPVPSGASGALVFAQYVVAAGSGGNTFASSAGLAILAP
ncbi:MAG TPA: hypothetical protein VJP77_04940, partial [Planctomycetota bacterium]|nr:hypothetical protein [Planctomycetota bacterium]